MNRTIIIAVLTLLSAGPSFSNTTQLKIEEPHPALRLMNDTEFAAFLGAWMRAWSAHSSS